MIQKPNYEELEKENTELRQKLIGREKELSCLYGLSSLVEEHGISLDEIMQKVPALLSSSWRYPEIACARILMGDKEFTTKTFRITEWRQSANILVEGTKAGEIEIYYLEKMPELDEGPFRNEERKLINAFAERLGNWKKK